MANTNFRVAGIDQAASKINRIISQATSSTKSSIKDISLDLLGKSKERAPLDIGDLRGSGFVEFEETQDNIKSTIGFTEKYALIQHERLDFNHPHGGEAKYLENPLKENLDDYIKHIKDGISEAVR